VHSKTLYNTATPEQELSLKKIKILIADTQHFNRLLIERRLNQLGLHRIAPVHDLNDMLKIIEYASTPFDIVIANTSFASKQLNLTEYFMDSAQVNNAFLYASKNTNKIYHPYNQQQKVKFNSSALPELDTLAELIALLPLAS